jgi:hypothetical protein
LANKNSQCKSTKESKESKVKMKNQIKSNPQVAAHSPSDIAAYFYDKDANTMLRCLKRNSDGFISITEIPAITIIERFQNNQIHAVGTSEILGWGEFDAKSADWFKFEDAAWSFTLAAIQSEMI